MKLIFILLLLGTVIYSCRPKDNKERAAKYYDSCMAAIRPSKIASEQMGAFILKVVKSSIKPDGTVRIATKDSLALLVMFNDLDSATEETKSRLNNLPPFDLFDLKEPSLVYIDKISKIIILTSKDILFNYQGNRTKMQQKELEFITNKFSTEALQTNKEYGETLRKFLIEFEIPFNE